MRSSPYADLSRPPLHEESLRRALVRPGELWSAIHVVPETGSTNADLIAAARHGEPHGSVLVAERQTAGRGRLDRPWLAPAQAAITMSVLLRPGEQVPPARLGWLPLLAGVALAETISRLGEVGAVLKWPNDLLVRTDGGEDDFGKCAGVLAEVSGDAVVIGVGLNVAQRADELPAPTGAGAYPPTSLALVAAACTDRDPLLRALLRRLAEWYDGFVTAGGDPDGSGLRAAYRERSHTVSRPLVVALPGGELVRGVATDVDIDGRLVVDTAQGARPLAAGDVLRVR